jgi:guanylate kinase
LVEHSNDFRFEEIFEMETPDSRLVILAGPSCVGKSPLEKALSRFYPQLRQKLQSLVLFNSRTPRPGELDGRDYHFRSRQHIANLTDDDRFIVLDVRGDLQALDLEQLDSDLKYGDVFFEGNPFIGEALQTEPALAGVKRLGVFMSPLSREEILFLQSQQSTHLPDLVTDVMRRKLLRRTRRQKGELSMKDLENIEVRASSAWSELKKAHSFQYVIPNHDGEDSENWDAFYYPLGDARLALNAFVALLTGAEASGVEAWDESVVT